LKTQEEQLDIVFGNRDGLSYREIARRMGCDPRTVKKYAEHPELIGKSRKAAPRQSKLDPFRDQIKAFLADDGGNHNATYICDQLVKCGYTGGYEIVKRAVSQLKGRRQQLAYVRFETIPGQQAQADCGEFIVTLPDGSSRKYYLFAMILGYSRKLFACLLDRCDLPSFLEAHLLAFGWFGGVPAEILYDRMRNVYIRDLCETKEAGDESTRAQMRPTFTQGLMTLAVHYGFEPQVAPAYSAWVKGKIERPMHFVRESFWRGYEFIDLTAANRDLTAWLQQSEMRVHGTTHERVDVRFAREKEHLRALPPTSCDISLRLTRRVHKDCTIAVEGNRYVLPHTLVGHTVTVRLWKGRLRIFNADQLVEQYEEPAVKGQIVGMDRGHYEALRADRLLQERKFGHLAGPAKKGRAKIKQTISPTVPPHPVIVEPIVLAQRIQSPEVERRPIDIYAHLGGEVSYA